MLRDREGVAFPIARSVTLFDALLFQKKDMQIVQRHNYLFVRVQSFDSLLRDIYSGDHGEYVKHVCKHPVRFSDELLYEKELHLLLQIQCIKSARFAFYFYCGYLLHESADRVKPQLP